MPEPRTTDGELTTVDLARCRIPTKQPDGPKLVPDKEPETVDRAAAAPESMPLFSEAQLEDFRSRWSNLQIRFVDEPRRAVEDADKLVTSVIQRLVDDLSNERSELEKQWDRADSVSTEDLRITLQRYRSFFDRLLKRKDERALGCPKEV